MAEKMMNYIEPTKSEPTMFLRFVRRHDGAGNTLRILQQHWQITEHKGGLHYVVTTEWRDVPLEDEKE